LPIDIIYLLILFAFILIVFLWLKRPIYEAVLGGFFLMLTITGHWGDIFKYIDGAFSTSLVYAIFVFIALSQLMTETRVIDDCINVILSVFGRIKGGAGFVSIISSTFMGAISGSGPGNVAATGVITIPAMKRSGFPAHLAANVESSASTLGNMIPPSGIIVASFTCLQVLYPDKFSIGQFWLLLWVIAVVFVLQRIIMLFAFCRHYKVEAMPKEELPSLRDSIKKGYKSLLIPLIILFPFILDYFCKDTFFAERLGKNGASAFSSSTLLFTAGVAALYIIAIAPKGFERSPRSILNLFGRTITKVVPTLATVIFAYFIGELFDDIGLGENISGFISSLNLGRVALAFLIPLFTAFLGMILPGSAQIAVFGTSLITIMVGAGFDPLLSAAMLPCICGAMSGMIPPVAVCTLTAMGIAESKMKPTMINCTIWVLCHYLLSVVVMLGVLPLPGV